VRAADHWCTDLRGYTCAAAPVLEPATGGLAGSIDLTTWSDSSSELLLGLAQTAASATSALMAARSGGRLVRPAPSPGAARGGLPGAGRGPGRRRR
jgi:transcriptional regulator of acetoin/glycerol metabolism